MIDPQTARDGAHLLSIAIGELMEDTLPDAIRMTDGDWRVVVVKADRLKAVGSDVASLAEAMAVLAKRSAP